MTVRFFVLLLLVSSGFSGQAQRKTASADKVKSAKAKPAKRSVEPPPVAADTAGYVQPPPPPELTLNFDTAAAPSDAFTLKIKELLAITGAQDADVQMVTKTLDENLQGQEDNPVVQAFKTRFIADMREGRMRRWLENAYIRTYRSSFTAEELDTLLTFYKTPLGQSIVKKQVQLFSAISGEGKKMGAYMGQVIMQEVLNEQKK